MIRNNILNFERNLREAGKYRLGLRESIIEKDIKRDVESLFLSKSINFNKLSFYRLNTRKPISATDLSYNYKNFSFFLFFKYKNLKTIDSIIDSFKSRNEIYFKVLNRDIKKLKDQLLESDIKLNSKYNKVKVDSFFEEKDFLESYDLVDLKTETTLLKTERLVFKDDVLKLPEYFKKEIKILKAEICWEESFFGDNLKPIKISKDASYLHREEKVFNWIVAKKEFNQSGQVMKERPVSLCFILHLHGEEYLNQLFVEFATELEVHLNNKSIDYWDGNSWVTYNDLSIVNEENRLQIFFLNEIKTKKIKIKFIQKNFFDLTKILNKSRIDEETEKLINNSKLPFQYIAEEEELYRVHDLSILDVIPKYTKYKNFGYFREANPTFINKALSFWNEVDFLHEDDDCFLEKSAHLVLFGEEDFEAIKKQNNQFERTPRYNNIIAIPNSIYVSKEMLVFKNKQAKCLFFPDVRKGQKLLKERIKVYRDSLELTMGTDYYISLDELGSFVNSNDNIATIESLYPEKMSGLFYIELKSKPKADERYLIEYDLDKSFYTDESKLLKIERGIVSLDTKLQSSVGFIRNRFCLRSFSKYNDSSFIKRYKTLVEEIEETEVSKIEYEDFKEVSGRSTSNVV
jgi:hypothetical protein